ncbi:MAG TPA: cupin domain-containing protein [Dehalococcoidia bacterium]|nr:cupin domain-containing protein [Dehalococcoidia bacterium]
MRVIHAHEGSTSEATNQPIFEGGPVWFRGLAGRQLAPSDELSVAVVQFGAGAKTRWHTHTSDQVLYVTAGIGKVGNRDGEHIISAHDCVVIPANEPHWHGAADTGSPMSHVAITLAASETKLEESDESAYGR